jgi:uncharacterized protein (DUF433 family)
MNAASKYQKNSAVLSKVFEDEVVLLPMHQNDAVELGKVYIITGTGIRIWELLEKGKSKKEIKETLVKEFDVSSQKAEKDITAFLKKLKEKGCIKEVSNEKEKVGN